MTIFKSVMVNFIIKLITLMLSLYLSTRAFFYLIFKGNIVFQKFSFYHYKNLLKIKRLVRYKTINHRTFFSLLQKIE